MHNLLKTDLSLGSFTAKIRSYEDFDVRSETSIPFGHNIHDDTHYDALKEASDPSSSLAVAPSLDFRIVSDNPNGSMIIPNSSLPLFSLGELKEGDILETDVSSNDRCGRFVESKDSI